LVAGKHGGDGGSQNDILRVDPDAVPSLRGAFADALARVDKQLELVDKEFRVTSWAADPVSTGATRIFNDRSLDADVDDHRRPHRPDPRPHRGTGVGAGYRALQPPPHGLTVT